MDKVFYIADLHLGHANVIRFDNRPFLSVLEMQETILKNWNDRVDDKDYVYILGDFVWGTEADWRRIVPKFNGKKVLIQGNHDLKQISNTTRAMFHDIRAYKEISDNRRHVVLCHYPILMYNKSFDSSTFMLCGHVHVTKENDLLEQFRAEIRRQTAAAGGNGPKGQIYNVGCMMPWMDYTPRTLDEIIERYGQAEKESAVR